MIGIIADTHLANHKRWAGESLAGVNARARLGLATLVRAIRAMHERGCDAIVIAGDLFDGVRPEPQLLAAVQEALATNELNVHILAGNHDTVSIEAGDHALGPLAMEDESRQVAIHDEANDIYASGCDVLMVPWQPGNVREWLPRELQRIVDGMTARVESVGGKLRERQRVLIGHFGIIHPGTPVYLNTSPEGIDVPALSALCKRYKIAAVFSGHWHDGVQVFPSLTNDVPIVQCGALVPSSFSDAVNGVGLAWTWDGESAEYVAVPGPRFVQVNGELAPEQLREALDAHEGCVLFARWTAKSSAYDGARRVFEDLCKEYEGRLLGEVVPDDMETKAAAARSSSAARNATNVDAALTEYVEGLVMPDGVTHDEVMAEARKYLGGV